MSRKSETLFKVEMPKGGEKASVKENPGRVQSMRFYKTPTGNTRIRITTADGGDFTRPFTLYKKKRKSSKYNEHVAKERRAGSTLKEAAASWKKFKWSDQFKSKSWFIQSLKNK